jgi:hypothetical protein
LRRTKKSLISQAEENGRQSPETNNFAALQEKLFNCSEEHGFSIIAD